MTGAELTGEQLNEVDGGLLFAVGIGVGILIGIGIGYALS
jgi:hypothetical protein